MYAVVEIVIVSDLLNHFFDHMMMILANNLVAKRSNKSI